MWFHHLSHELQRKCAIGQSNNYLEKWIENRHSAIHTMYKNNPNWLRFWLVNKLVQNSSLPLVKVTIFQKQLRIVQINVHQEEPTHLPLILIQICKNRIKNKVLIMGTKSGMFWKTAKSPIQLYKIVLTEHEICTVQWLILQSPKTFWLCSFNQNSYFLSNFYKFGIKMCMFVLMYLNLHCIKQFLKYLDFCKWQGTFFDEFTSLNDIFCTQILLSAYKLIALHGIDSYACATPQFRWTSLTKCTMKFGMSQLCERLGTLHC